MMVIVMATGRFAGWRTAMRQVAHQRKHQPLNTGAFLSALISCLKPHVDASGNLRGGACLSVVSGIEIRKRQKKSFFRLVDKE